MILVDLNIGGYNLSKIYVITSGRGINLILHKWRFSNMKDAEKKAIKLKKQGKKYVSVKSYKEGESLSHEKYI